MQGQMSAFAADVGDGSDDVARQFLLYIEVPLLDVRPNHLVRNRCNGEREKHTATDVAVAVDVELGSVK